MPKDYKPVNAGSFKVGDFVRYSKSFCKKFHYLPEMTKAKGEVRSVGQIGLVKFCEVSWSDEPDFLHSVCFDNLEIWQPEF